MTTPLSLTSLEISGYLLWKAAEIKFRDGVTKISGPNRSGKTLLFRTLDHAFWGAAAAKRGSSKSKQPAGSVIKVSGVKDGRSFCATVKPSSMTLTFQGEDSGTRGVRAGRRELEALMPISKSLYDATVHLTGDDYHPLSNGSPAQRMQWLGDVLGINEAYDTLFRRTKKMYDKVKDAESELRAAEAELKTVHIPNVAVDPERIKARIERLRKELKALDAEIEQRTRRKELRGSLRTDVPVARLPAEISRIEAKLAKYTRLQAAIDAYEENAEQFARNKEQREQLLSVLNDIPRTPFLKADEAVLNDLRQAVQDALYSLSERLRRWDAESDHRRQLKGLKSPKDDHDTLQKQQRETAVNLGLATQAAKALRKITGPACPVCQSPLSKAAKNKLLSTTTQRVHTCEQLLSQIETGLKFYETKDRVTLFRRPPVEKVASLLETLDSAVENRRLHRETKRLLKQLDDTTPTLQRPKLPSVDGRPIDITREAARLETKLSALRNDITIHGVLKTLPAPNVTLAPSSEDLRKRAGDLTAQISTMETEYARMVEARAIAKRETERRDRLQEAVNRLRIESRRAVNLSLLMEAFGPKGLRQVKIRERAEQLVSALNDLAHIMWGEPMDFSIESSDDGISILVRRNNIDGDLGSLSGSENKCWRMLSALVLLRMLPARWRTDFIVLDELEANLDPDSRYRFARDFLPELQTTVSKVIIVSPLSDEELPILADHSYRVVKQNGVSKLIPVGKPKLVSKAA